MGLEAGDRASCLCVGDTCRAGAGAGAGAGTSLKKHICLHSSGLRAALRGRGTPERAGKRRPVMVTTEGSHSQPSGTLPCQGALWAAELGGGGEGHSPSGLGSPETPPRVPHWPGGPSPVVGVGRGKLRHLCRWPPPLSSCVTEECAMVRIKAALFQAWRGKGEGGEGSHGQEGATPSCAPAPLPTSGSAQEAPCPVDATSPAVILTHFLPRGLQLSLL